MKTVPFGPVFVRSEQDLTALFERLQKPTRGTKGLRLQAITFTVVPGENGTPTKKPKPGIAFQPYWPWSGISFWG
jgi:hypothetical protein